LKQVWYVSPGSTNTLVGHTCRGNVRLLRHRLSRNHRSALEAGRAVYKLETCPYCHRRCLLELYLGRRASDRLPVALPGAD
jgi:hypothetical protein